jgi:hypothetical protein
MTPVLKITSDMTREEMIETFVAFLEEFGAGFHPETNAHNYCTRESKDTELRPTFNNAEGDEFNSSLDILYSALGEDIWGVMDRVLNL